MNKINNADTNVWKEFTLFAIQSGTVTIDGKKVSSLEGLFGKIGRRRDKLTTETASNLLQKIEQNRTLIYTLHKSDKKPYTEKYNELKNAKFTITEIRFLFDIGICGKNLSKEMAEKVKIIENDFIKTQNEFNEKTIREIRKNMRKNRGDMKYE